MPGSYGDNIPTSESSRELILLLQKLIRVIGENGPISVTEFAPLIGGTTTGLIAGPSGDRPVPVGSERRTQGGTIVAPGMFSSSSFATLVLDPYDKSFER